MLAKSGALINISKSCILRNYSKSLPRDERVDNLFSYLVLEFLAKIQQSIDHVKLNNGENVLSLCNVFYSSSDSIGPLNDLQRIKRTLKFPFGDL